MKSIVPVPPPLLARVMLATIFVGFGVDLAVARLGQADALTWGGLALTGVCIVFWLLGGYRDWGR